MIAVDTYFSQISLPAGRFRAYLHEEGHNTILMQRDANGTATMPGCERFNRHVEILLNLDGESDPTAVQPQSQHLAIVPLPDPFKGEGKRIGFA